MVIIGEAAGQMVLLEVQAEMLPKFNTSDQALSLLQTTWSSQLNPLLALPLSSSLVLKKVSLTSGKNTINHTLGRELQGWFIVRQRGSASIYDTQDVNKLSDKTLVLMASSGVSVDILCF